MRTLVILSLLPLALPAQTIVSSITATDWKAYPAYINAKSTSFDFHDMAGTTDGALTITTSGVAAIASRGITGTALSSFVGATYRWQGDTRVVGLKLEVYRGLFWSGTLVYDPAPASSPTDWNTAIVDASSSWRLTSATSGPKYNTLSGWLSDSRVGAATISAIELGLGSSNSTTDSIGSIDWIDYSLRSGGGSAITTSVDFAAPIPEPATTATLVAIGSLGMALVARRRKSRQ
jgi:hypothetical protein